MSKMLAIVTVVYKNYSILNDFFASIEKQNDKNFKVYVADLTDKKENFPYPSYVSLINSDNKGYAHGINLGIVKAFNDKLENIAVINNDVEIAPDFTYAVKNSLTAHPGSLIGGKIYYGAGYEYHKKYKPAELGHVLWYAGGVCDWKNAITIHRGVDEVDEGKYERFESTDFITGCLTCFDKQVVTRIGLWDESYFMYYEDADYCERAKRNGIGLYYDPSIVIWHKNAASTGGSGSKLQATYQRKNHLVFGLKYAPFRTKLHLLKNYLFTK